MLERLGSVNLPALAISVAFVLGMLVLHRLVEPFLSHRTPALHTHGWVGVGLAALFAAYLFVAIAFEPQVFGSPYRTFLQRYSVPLQFVLILLCAYITLYAVRKIQVLQTTANKWNLLEIAWIALMVCLSVYAAYKPNVLNGNGGNLYHFHAYFNSIYHLFHGRPFSGEITSIYGHYAFFFLPFHKITQIIGRNNEVLLVLMVLAALQGISVLLYAYVLRILIDNRFLRILGLMSVCMAPLSLEDTLYVQTYPHRTFPYAVMVALLTLWYSKKEKRRFITAAGYLASAVILIWSTECGVICAVTWAALHCCAAIQEKGLLPWAKVAAHFGALFTSIAGGYALTCLLNLLCGGAWIPVREFLFPLMTDSYMTGFLEEPLAAFPAAWVPITATLLYFLGIGLSGTVLCTRYPEKEPSFAVYFAMGVLGLGTLTYAFNRPTYGNFYIILPLMSVLMCLLVQRNRSLLCSYMENGISTAKDFSLWDGFCGGIGTVLLSVLLLLGVFATTNYGAMQQKRQPYRDYYSIEFMQDWLTETASPENFTAIGRGSLEICASLGWENGFPVMDYSDITINPAHLAYADSLLESLDDQCVLFEASAYQTHEESGLPGLDHFLENHIQTETMFPPSEVSDLSFYYFVPVSYVS